MTTAARSNPCRMSDDVVWSAQGREAEGNAIQCLGGSGNACVHVREFPQVCARRECKRGSYPAHSVACLLHRFRSLPGCVAWPWLSFRLRLKFKAARRLVSRKPPRSPQTNEVRRELRRPGCVRPEREAGAGRNLFEASHGGCATSNARCRARAVPRSRRASLGRARCRRRPRSS